MAGSRIGVGRAAVLEPRDAVAQGGEAEPEHRRAGGRVADLIKPALLEAALDPDVTRVVDHAAADRAGEAPPLPGDRLGRGVELVADEEHGVALLEVGGRMRQVTAIGEQEMGDGLGRLQVDVDPAAHRVTASVTRLGRVQPEEPRQLRHVALPAARHDDPAAPHQEAVTHVDRRIGVGVRPEHRPGGMVEVGHGDRVAAVDDVEDHAAAAARTLDRQQDRHIGGELHAPLGVAWGEPDVGDPLVGGVRRVDGEAEASLELFVGTDLPEGVPPGERASEREVEAGDGHRCGETVRAPCGPCQPPRGRRRRRSRALTRRGVRARPSGRRPTATPARWWR